MLEQYYDLSIIPGHSIAKVHASQWEDGVRQFVFNLYNDSGLYEIPTGATVEVRGTKADGHGFAVSNNTHPAYISYSGSAVSVITMKQMCACAGEQDFKLNITIGGKLIASARFTLVVDEDTLSEDTDTSDTVLPEIIDAARTSAAQAAASATAAASSESNAATSESNAAQSASDAEQSATAAASYSVNVPYIGANGNWWVWNTTQGQYVDSGVDASITLQIADITMLDASATPYVTNTGTDTDPIFHLFLPRGMTGKTAYQSAVEGGYTGTEAEFESDLSHFKEWKDDAEDAADSAAENAASAHSDALAAKAQADRAEMYADFVEPHFLIANNRLYVRDDATGEFIVANNRLYMKLTTTG